MSLVSEQRFFAHLDEFAKETCLVCEEGEALSYAEILARADALDLARHRRGLAFIVGGNNPATVVGYIAALRAGHAVCLLDPDGRAESERLKDCLQPDYIIDCCGGIEKVTKTGANGPDLHPDLAVLLPTSGSTGGAKTVKLTYSNISTNTESIVDYLSLTSSDRCAATLRFVYSFGLSVLNTHLFVGGSLLFIGAQPYDASFWPMAEHFGVTNVCAIPFTFETMARRGINPSVASRLRFMAQAGGKLTPDLVRHYALDGYANRYDFFVMYGQTEASPRMAYLPPELAAEHPSSIGKAIPGGKLWLEDSEGGRIEGANVEGELVYSGPNIMAGYASCRADLAVCEYSETLRTGDLAVRNEAGLFEITGRKSRFAKLFGHRISLDDVERLLPRPSAVVASDERLHVFLETAFPREARKSALYLSRHLQMPLNAVNVLPTQALPRLASGKVDYVSLKERARKLSQCLQQPPRSMAREIMIEFASLVLGRQEEPLTVLAAFQSVLPDRRLGPDATWITAAGDSLSEVQLSLLLEAMVPDLPEDWARYPISKLEAMRGREAIWQ